MNLLKLTLTLIIFISGFQLKAQIETDVAYGADNNQPKDLFKTTVLQKGIYHNFNELKKNDPTGLKDFQSKSRSGIVPTYEIRGGAKNKKIKKAYGFSDGQSVFINANNYGRGNYYVRVELIGPYLFFRDQGGGSGIGLGGAIAVGPVAIGTGGGGNNVRPFVLDMNTGVITQLKPKTLRAILAKDKELLRAYEGEKQRNNIQTIYEYIRLYNEKHG